VSESVVGAVWICCVTFVGMVELRGNGYVGGKA
jgi:hypothetical protein